ncbi:MAG: MgtC/SapB family protein [Chloroflexi bacterium]|nr:MgtC/SapB family protein [Chloroflexota bacterium]
MNTLVDMVLRLLLATALGAGIGYQRERANKPAGLRTHILISLGSALFTVVSIFGFGDGVDVSRVAAGVVTGIGFIGAGVIFRGIRGDHVAGLTTAASIWATASIGLAAGAGMYLIATVVAAIAVLVLMIPSVKG